MVVEAGMEAGNFRRCKGYFAQISLKFARNTFMQQTISLQNFFSCWYIILSSTNCHRIQHTNCLAWNLVLNNPTEDVTLGCWRTLSEVSCLSTLQHLHHSYEVWHSIHIPAVAFSKELTWVYLAIIGNFQLKKEVFAKTPGHRKKTEAYRVVAAWRWIISVTNKVQIEVLSIPGNALPDDQHSCAGNAGAQPLGVAQTV